MRTGRKLRAAVIAKRLSKIECRYRILYHLARWHSGAFEQQADTQQALVRHRSLQHKSMIAQPVAVVG